MHAFACVNALYRRLFFSSHLHACVSNLLANQQAFLHSENSCTSAFKRLCNLNTSFCMNLLFCRFFYFSVGFFKGQFPVSGLFRPWRNLDNKELLSRNYLLNFRATFSLANSANSAHSESSTDWKSALRGKGDIFLLCILTPI